MLRRLDARHRRFAVVGGLSTHTAFAAAVTSRVAAAVPEAVCVPPGVMHPTAPRCRPAACDRH